MLFIDLNVKAIVKLFIQYRLHSSDHFMNLFKIISNHILISIILLYVKRSNDNLAEEVFEGLLGKKECNSYMN